MPAREVKLTTMQANTPESEHRAGYVSIAGRPNVGKSTLLNALLGQKVAAVTYRPQTTRKQQLGILSLDHAQLIFIDTPGIHLSRHKLGEKMNVEAERAFEDANLVLIVVDASLPPQEEDILLAETLARVAPGLQKLVALNKIDRVEEETLAEIRAAYQEIFPGIDICDLSARTGQGLPQLLLQLIEALPVGPPYFPPDQLTDLYEREITADLIREAALLHLRDEIPHSIAVRIDEFKERGDSGAFIAATLFVERESQIGIVVGSKGRMLKRIGTHARREVEAMSGRKVHLELRVKLRKNWRNDEGVLQQFGFRR